MSDFAESTVVITGASRGIGREIALAFARRTDHSLWLLARDRERLQETAAECRRSGFPNVKIQPVDLTDPDQVERLTPPESLPDPGIVIHSAGYFLLKPLQETGSEEFRRQWMLHTEAAFGLDRKLLPVLKQRERGLIVHIASSGALRGQPRSGAYSSSKHALLGYSRSLRRELLPSRVAVTALNLGQTWSHSWQGVDVEPEELIDPGDVGTLLVQLSKFSPRTVAEEIVLAPQHGRRSPD